MNVKRTQIKKWIKGIALRSSSISCNCDRALVLVAVVFAIAIFYRTNLRPMFSPFSGVIGSWDGSFYYFWLRSVLFDRDVNFLNEVLYYNTWNDRIREQVLSQPLTITGLIANKYTIGWAIYSAPWMLLGHICGLILSFFGSNVKLDGYGAPYQSCLVVGQFVYATIALIYLYKLANALLENRLPFSYLALFWLGSFLPFYQVFQTTLAHNVTLLSVVIVSWLAYRIQQDKETERAGLISWVMLGVVSGLAVLSRAQSVVWLIYPLLVSFRDIGLFSPKRIRIYRPLVGLFAFVVTILPQLICWKLLYGSFFTYSYKGETFSWGEPQIGKVLFSSFHGLFYWHPIYLLGLVGFFCWVSKKKELTANCLAISCILTMYINASWYCWWFGVSFGARAFESVTLPAFIGWCYFISNLGTRNKLVRTTGWCLILTIILWNVNLTVSAIKGVLPLDRPLSYSEMLEVSMRFWPVFFKSWT